MIKPTHFAAVISVEERHDLDCRFDYNAPKESHHSLYSELRAQAKVLATSIMLSQPTSAERLTALQKLDEVVMWAFSGIARNT